MSKTLIEQCKKDEWSVGEFDAFFKKNKNVNVNAKEFFTQMGALHYAARQGNVTVCGMLVHRGAKLESKSTYGWTALHIAAYNGQTKVVELLLKSGANVHATTRWYKYTPLHFACEENEYDCVVLLLKYKADPKIKANKKNCYQISEGERVRGLLKEYFRSIKPPDAPIVIRPENLDLNLDKHILVWLDCVIDEKSVPIVYRKEHNISFMKIEELHPFDSTKFEKIANFLVKDAIVKNHGFFVQGKMMTEKFLEKLHTKSYLKSLKSSVGVAKVLEFVAAAVAPYFLIKNIIVNPMLYQAGGTVLAGELAMKYGWAINLGGGMHHASSKEGGGWCAYGDIQLSLINLREQKKVKKAMIIDLDAHQGNGHERDKLGGLLGKDDEIYIVDIYNKQIYPGDTYAKGAINLKYGIREGTETKEYIKVLDEAMKKAFDAFKPDIVFYNAGTDILENDPLGYLSISDKGIIQRDYMVFEPCIKRKIPIVMVTSGGYQKSNARIIADSIKNLHNKLRLDKIAKENYKKNISKLK